MKKYSTILLIALFTSVVTHAQDKGYIGISLGPSFASGDFGSSDRTNQNAGLAQTGAIFDISFAYKFAPNFGMTALLRGQANNVNTDAIKEQFIDPTTVESTAWTTGGFLVGGYGSFDINEAFAFETRAMIGFLNTTSPQLTISSSSSGIDARAKQNSVTASSLAFLVGAGLKYNLGNKVCLLLHIDYMQTEPEFKNVESTVTVAGFTSTNTNTFSQKIQTVNVGLGVGFRL